MIKTFTYTGCMVNHAVFDAHFHARFLDRVCFHKGMHEKTASLTVHTVQHKIPLRYNESWEKS